MWMIKAKYLEMSGGNRYVLICGRNRSGRRMTRETASLTWLMWPTWANWLFKPALA